MTERQKFEAWYVENVFDIVGSPLGSRDCGLQWKAWQASSKQALSEAAEECDGFGDYYMEMARGGDKSGANDHKADAAEEIAAAIRSLSTPDTEGGKG